MDIKTLLTLLIGLTARVFTSKSNWNDSPHWGLLKIFYTNDMIFSWCDSCIFEHPIQAISGIIYAYLNSGKIQIDRFKYITYWYLLAGYISQPAGNILIMLTWDFVHLEFEQVEEQNEATVGKLQEQFTATATQATSIFKQFNWDVWGRKNIGK